MKQQLQLIKSYEAGATMSQLVKEFGISKGSVCRLVNDAGASRRPNSPSEGQLAEAERLYIEELWSLERIGNHLGFAASTLYRHLIKRGVTIRHHPGGRSRRSNADG